MSPTLSPCDRVLVRRRAIDAVRVGDVVVVEPPDNVDGRWKIKRAVALPGDPVPPGIAPGVERVPVDALVVRGDHPDSVDSRQRGFFDASTLLGVVSRRI